MTHKTFTLGVVGVHYLFVTTNHSPRSLGSVWYGMWYTIHVLQASHLSPEILNGFTNAQMTEKMARPFTYIYGLVGSNSVFQRRPSKQNKEKK